MMAELIRRCYEVNLYEIIELKHIFEFDAVSPEYTLKHRINRIDGVVGVEYSDFAGDCIRFQVDIEVDSRETRRSVLDVILDYIDDRNEYVRKLEAMKNVTMGDMRGHASGFVYSFDSSQAPQVAKWFSERGGIAIWENKDLSRGPETVVTPLKAEDGEPCDPPHWRFGHVPVLRVTDRGQVAVVQVTTVEQCAWVPLKNGQASARTLAAISECMEEYGPHAWYEEPEPGDKEPVALIKVARDPVALDKWFEREAASG